MPNKNQCDICFNPSGIVKEENGLKFCEKCLWNIEVAKIVKPHILLKHLFITISDRSESDLCSEDLYSN